jgi:hypothetical protein
MSLLQRWRMNKQFQQRKLFDAGVESTMKKLPTQVFETWCVSVVELLLCSMLGE